MPRGGPRSWCARLLSRILPDVVPGAMQNTVGVAGVLRQHMPADLLSDVAANALAAADTLQPSKHEDLKLKVLLALACALPPGDHMRASLAAALEHANRGPRQAPTASTRCMHDAMHAVAYAVAAGRTDAVPTDAAVLLLKSLSRRRWHKLGTVGKGAVVRL
jgi:hypothetical protein